MLKADVADLCNPNVTTQSKILRSQEWLPLFGGVPEKREKSGKREAFFTLLGFAVLIAVSLLLMAWVGGDGCHMDPVYGWSCGEE